MGAVRNMAAFCTSLISCFPGMLLRYCLSDSEMVPFAPIFTGITFAFTFYMHSLCIVRSSHYIIQRDSKRWTQFHTSIFPEL